MLSLLYNPRCRRPRIVMTSAIPAMASGNASTAARCRFRSYGESIVAQPTRIPDRSTQTVTQTRLSRAPDQTAAAKDSAHPAKM
jgi:hypothetical protein